MREGFDNDKYIELQAEHIRERVGQFGGKLYLEFGGKLFDDYHASRVLPGFEPDSKARMLRQLADDAEVVFALNANDIEQGKRRGDIGISYGDDVLRLMDVFRGMGLWALRLQFTTENPGEIDKILMDYQGRAAFDAGSYTRGLYSRGVE